MYVPEMIERMQHLVGIATKHAKNCEFEEAIPVYLEAQEIADAISNEFSDLSDRMTDIINRLKNEI